MGGVCILLYWNEFSYFRHLLVIPMLRAIFGIWYLTIEKHPFWGYNRKFPVTHSYSVLFFVTANNYSSHVLVVFFFVLRFWPFSRPNLFIGLVAINYRLKTSFLCTSTAPNENCLHCSAMPACMDCWNMFLFMRYFFFFLVGTQNKYTHVKLQ